MTGFTRTNRRMNLIENVSGGSGVAEPTMPTELEFVTAFRFFEQTDSTAIADYYGNRSRLTGTSTLVPGFGTSFTGNPQKLEASSLSEYEFLYDGSTDYTVMFTMREAIGNADYYFGNYSLTTTRGWFMRKTNSTTMRMYAYGSGTDSATMGSAAFNDGGIHTFSLHYDASANDVYRCYDGAYITPDTNFIFGPESGDAANFAFGQAVGQWSEFEIADFRVALSLGETTPTQDGIAYDTWIRSIVS